MADVTVRLASLDGGWEVCGADRARGLWPENVKGVKADGWGSKTVGFDLRRDPRSVWPDIAAFTPVEIDINGVKRWSGRVASTPTRDDLDSVISVQCEGWQAHLDDDLYERGYVHTRLTEWQDVRQSLMSDLTSFVAAPQVNSGRGGTALAFPANVVAANAKAAGIGIDLGPGSLGKRVVATWEAFNTHSGQAFDLRASDVAFGTFGGDLYAGTSYGGTLGTGGAQTGTFAVTLSTARRYLWFYMYQGSGGDFTPTADQYVRLTSIQVFADTAFESGGASVLKSDDVITDALDRATIMISADRSRMGGGSFSIPEFWLTEPRTPRQVWEAANAFEDLLSQIDLDARPVYITRPTAPDIEVGAWSAMTFEDASANDGSEIYSRCIVKATRPDGTPLRVERTQSQQPGVAQDVLSSPAATNPSFATNTTGWTATGSTITRDTGSPDSSPASGRWDNTGASDNLTPGDMLSTTFSGTFRAGVPYTVTFRVKANADVALGFVAYLGSSVSDRGYGYPPLLQAGVWTDVSVQWVPSINRPSAALELVTLESRYYQIDSLAVHAATPTLVERRGFRRTKVLDLNLTLTTAAATQIADLWLRAHQRTPFKGTVKLTGTGAARDILTGTPLPVDALLAKTGRLIRFSDRIDPDTGAVGRDARIADVSVDPDTEEAIVTLDSSRSGFDQLLARLEVVLGQGN